jgi:hypothetical protein
MAEEDLILGNPDDESSLPDAEFELDETLPIEYIDTAMTVLNQLDGMDTSLMTQLSARRIKQMRHWAIYIAWSNLKDIYDTLTDQQED